VRPGTDAARREAVLNDWYRLRLREQLPSLMAKWEPKVGVSGAELRIKKMKTHWRTCNAAARRIWLNLELSKKPISCLEYTLVHELVHLIEQHHNEYFRESMDRLMPQWRMHREELNRAPLAHEEWEYRVWQVENARPEHVVPSTPGAGLSAKNAELREICRPESDVRRTRHFGLSTQHGVRRNSGQGTGIRWISRLSQNLTRPVRYSADHRVSGNSPMD